MLYLAEDNFKRKKELENQILLLEQQLIGDKVEREKVILPPVSLKNGAGKFPIGDIVYNNKVVCPIGLNPDEIIQHTVIFGRSGAGKTNLGLLMIKNFLKTKVPFLVFDWKRNYRDFLGKYPNSSIKVYTVGRDVSPFRFNPLIPPPGVHPRIYLPKLIEIIAHSYFLGEGVMYLLMKVLDSVYQDSGVYAGIGNYPAMQNVLERLEKYQAKGRESLWLSSTLRSIASLCFGEVGKVINGQQGINIEDLLRQNVILELDGLSDSNKIFFIESLLLWIHQYRMGEGKREILKHVIFIEEAHHILHKNKQETKSGETVVEVLIREIRELGEGIIMLDQMPSLFSLAGLANSYTTISFNLKTGSDIRAIADSMALTSEEHQYLGRLNIGEAIVKLQGRIRSPVMVKIPHFPIKKGQITDSYLKKRVKISDFTDSKAFEGSQKERKVIPPANSRDKLRENGLPESGLDEDEYRFLKNIADNPTSTIVERYKRLNLSTQKGNTIKEKLIETRFISPLSVSVRKGKVILLQIECKGNEYLRLRGDFKEHPLRYGGLIHRFWIDRIATQLQEKGFDVHKEHPIGKGKTVDIFATKDAQRIIVEVETGKSDYMRNLEKVKNLEDHKIIFLFTGKKQKEDFEKVVAQGNNNQIVSLHISVNLTDYGLQSR